MKMKKCLALALSASMVAGMTMATTSLAADPTTSVTMPVYSMNILNVIVPTKFSVAFNPKGLKVKTGTDANGAVISTSTVLSKKYAVINKSNTAQDLSISFKVKDLNVPAKPDSNVPQLSIATTDITPTDKYGVCLKVVPSSNAGLTETETIKRNTITAAQASDLTFTNHASVKQVLTAGDNVMNFFLDKTAYKEKTGSPVTLGSTATNNVAGNYEIDAVPATATAGFTFDGAINTSSDWTKITKGISIIATYNYVKTIKTESGGSYTAPTNAPIDNALFTAGAAEAATIKTFTYATANIEEITKVELVDSAGASNEVEGSGVDTSGTTKYTISGDIPATITENTAKAIITYTNKNGVSGCKAQITLNLATGG